MKGLIPYVLYVTDACTEGRLSTLKIKLMKYILVYIFMLNHLIVIVTFLKHIFILNDLIVIITFIKYTTNS